MIHPHPGSHAGRRRPSEKWSGGVEARRSARARLLIMTTDNMDTKTMGDDYKDEDGEMEMTKTKMLGDGSFCVVFHGCHHHQLRSSPHIGFHLSCSSQHKQPWWHPVLNGASSCSRMRQHFVKKGGEAVVQGGVIINGIQK